MTIQINQELCAGCGVCADTCPEGAIQLMVGQAMIDDALCTQCEACIDACPNGAISVISMPERSAAIMSLPVIETSPVPAKNQPVFAISKAPARGLVPLAGAALAFLGHEVAPRLVDILVSALERRLDRSATTPTVRLSTSSPRSLSTQSKGKQRQTRYRRGGTGFRKPKARGRRNLRITSKDERIL
jgi:Fe-S-cluster-containing hydrogenase component 2